MKKSAITFALLLTTLFCFSQTFDKDARTIVKSIPVSENDMLLDFSCDLEVSHWQGDKIRMLIEVKLENQRPAIIKELVKLHRYDIEFNTFDSICFLSIPELNKVVKVNDEILKEFVRITVLIPEGMTKYIHPTGAIAISSKNPNSTI